MENRRVKLDAFAFSVAIHLALVFTSTRYVIPNLSRPDVQRQKRFQVRVTKEKKFIPREVKEAIKPVKKLRFESREYAGSIDSFLEGQKNLSTKKDLNLDEYGKEEMAKAEADPRLYDVKEKLENDDLKQSRVDRDVTPDKNKLRVNYHELISQADEYLSVADVTEDFIDKMPGFTPVLVDDRAYVYRGGRGGTEGVISGKVPSSITRRMNIGDFAGELIWTLETYKDPRENQKYFRVTFRVRDEAKTLPTLPKEVVFLVDSSLSVEENRLNEFKEGILYSLNRLNGKDLFNIALFKDRIYKFRKESVAPEADNITAAAKFIDNFEVGQKTDVFDVLEKSVKRKAAVYPSYIILLSDGRPTKGVIRPRELINRISEINNGGKPIFAFCGGSGTNRYLLDFISYKNRGWAEYSYRSNRISENLSRLYDKIDEPIIMNLRYFISGVEEKETFPEILPDFFRKAEFTIYGRYDNEEELAVQLLGDVSGETREFVLSGAFADADKGDKDIAKNWAYNKIYHLISRMEDKGDNKELLDQIRELSKKFKLKTPYLKDIIK